MIESCTNTDGHRDHTWDGKWCPGATTAPKQRYVLLLRDNDGDEIMHGYVFETAQAIAEFTKQFDERLNMASHNTNLDFSTFEVPVWSGYNVEDVPAIVDDLEKKYG